MQKKTLKLIFKHIKHHETRDLEVLHEPKLDLIIIKRERYITVDQDRVITPPREQERVRVVDVRVSRELIV